MRLRLLSVLSRALLSAKETVDSQGYVGSPAPAPHCRAPTLHPPPPRESLLQRPLRVSSECPAQGGAALSRSGAVVKIPQSGNVPGT